jgi:hypothetical protein
MRYVATLTLDYTNLKVNEYQRLLVAFEHAGWEYVETSALVYEADDLVGVLRALALLSKSAHLGGDLSALNLQVQAVGFGKNVATTRNPSNAYRDVMALPGPPAP